MVTVGAYEPPPDPTARVGFLKGRIEVPDDFDTMGLNEMSAMFESEE